MTCCPNEKLPSDDPWHTGQNAEPVIGTTRGPPYARLLGLFHCAGYVAGLLGQPTDEVCALNRRSVLRS
jgi:hypothetical protein